MNYIEYTQKLIEIHLEPDKCVLIVGAGFNPSSVHFEIKNVKPENIIISDPGMKIDKWCEWYLNSTCFRPMDLVILSRVLEHFEIRHVDWYICNLYRVMAEKSKLICTIPDMPALAERIQREFEVEHPDYFKIQRLNFELFSGGDDVFDRHALWTSEASVRKYLTMEGLFKIESIDSVSFDAAGCYILPKYIEFTARRR